MLDETVDIPDRCRGPKPPASRPSNVLDLELAVDGDIGKHHLGD